MFPSIMEHFLSMAGWHILFVVILLVVTIEAEKQRGPTDKQRVIKHMNKANVIFNLNKGKCRGIWRSDELVGRCFGLKVHNTYPELKNTSTIISISECRTACCLLGSKCVSWQYESVTNVCKIGDPVRLGTEGANTPYWCEPSGPISWNGRKKRVLEKSDGNCQWTTEGLPNQCFGLGGEQLNSTNGRMGTTECEAACCNDPKCWQWQEQAGRGCYFTSNKDVWCEQALGRYTGGRKCVKNFCGGMEDTYLRSTN